MVANQNILGNTAPKEPLERLVRQRFRLELRLVVGLGVGDSWLGELSSLETATPATMPAVPNTLVSVDVEAWIVFLLAGMTALGAGGLDFFARTTMKVDVVVCKFFLRHARPRIT